jgi:hypothetical protein
MMNRRIAGPDPGSGTFEYFLQTILVDLDNGETYDGTRPGGYYNNTVTEVVTYTENNGEAISFFGYSYFLKDKALLYAVPIKNDGGVYVAPSAQTISDGSYNPLARRIFMNLRNNAASLDGTRPFIVYGFSEFGTVHVEATGFVPIDISERELLLNRLPAIGTSFDVTLLPSSEQGTVPSASTVTTPNSSPTTGTDTTSSSGSLSTERSVLTMLLCILTSPLLLS